MTLRRSLGWSFSQQIGVYVLQLVNMMVIARLLSPEEVGVFILALAVNESLSAVRVIGIGPYLVREEHLTDQKIRTAFGLLIVLSCIFGVAILGLRTPLERLMGTEGIADVLLIVSLIAFLTPLVSPAEALLTREMRFDLVHHANLSARVLGVGTSIGLALSGMSYMALAWGMLAERLLHLAILLACERRHLRLGPSLSEWRQIARFGGWLTGAQVTGKLSEHGTKFILGGILGTGAPALFDRAFRIPMLARRGLFMPLSRVFLPAFAKDVREGRAIGGKVLKLVAVTSAVVWPAFLAIGLLSERIVLLLFGDNWSEVAVLLPWLLAAHATNALLPQPNQILVPHNKVRRLFFFRIVQVVVTLGLALLAVSYGLEVFAMSQLLSSVILLVGIWIAIAPFVGVDIRRLMEVHAMSLTATVAAVAPTAAVVFGLGEAGWSLGLLTALLVAPFIWLGVLHMLHHPLAGEFENIAWKLLRKQRA